jgi:hypothetical protein
MTHTKQKNSNGILRQVIAWGWIYGTLSYGQVFEYKRVSATKYMYDLHLGLTTYSSNNVSSTTKETQVTTRNEIHLHRFDCVYEDSSFLEYQSVYRAFRVVHPFQTIVKTNEANSSDISGTM